MADGVELGVVSSAREGTTALGLQFFSGTGCGDLLCQSRRPLHRLGLLRSALSGQLRLVFLRRNALATLVAHNRGGRASATLQGYNALEVSASLLLRLLVSLLEIGGQDQSLLLRCSGRSGNGGAGCGCGGLGRVVSRTAWRRAVRVGRIVSRASRR